jgi:RNA polymerase sigma-70 factor (ECF subfamily)
VRGIAGLEPLEREAALANYYLLPAVAARLHAELGDRDTAIACYRRALERPCSEPERRFLRARLGQLTSSSGRVVWNNGQTAGLQGPAQPRNE